MPNVIIMTGLPASGKSTIRSLFDVDRILSTDDFIDSYARAIKKTYSEVFSEVAHLASIGFEQMFRVYINLEHSFIIDQTNLSVKKRSKLLKDIPETYKKISCFVSCDEDTRQKRLVQRPGKIIPKHIDDSMIQSLVIPQKEEGFDIMMTVKT